MTSPSACPSEAELEALLLGKLSEAESAALRDHVSHCSTCEELAASLDAVDPLVESVQAGGRLVEPDGLDVAALWSQALARSHVSSNVPGDASGDTPSNVDVEEPTSIASQEFPGKALLGLAAPIALNDPADGATFIRPGASTPVGSSLLGSSVSSSANPMQERSPRVDDPRAAGELGRVGDFRILSILGQGGMGIVFLAEDTNLQRLVALKSVKGGDQHPSLVLRFLREARAAAKFQHPNLATIFSVGQSGETPYISMELLKGPDLEQRVRKDGPLDWRSAAEAIRHAARGLQHAHFKGVIHRDVKPSNLMYGEEGLVKVLDLGVARLSAEALAEERHAIEATRKGMLVGTLNYMAPEQALDPTAVDERADVFSLGGVLHFLLTGDPPYLGLSRAHLLERKTPAPAGPSECPESLSVVLTRMLAPQLSKRYRNMGEVIAALDNVLREPVAVAPHSPAQASVPAAPNVTPAASAPAASGPSKSEPFARPTARWIDVVFAGVLLIALALGGLALFRGSGSPSPVASEGELVLTIFSEHLQGATVFIDDAPRDVSATKISPLTLKIAPGDHELRVEHARLNTFTRRFRIAAGESKRIDILASTKDSLLGGEPVAESASGVAATPSRVKGTWPLGPTENALIGSVPCPTPVLDGKRWQAIGAAPDGHLSAIDWHPFDRRVACASDMSIRIYDADTLAVVGYAIGFEGCNIASLKWSPDGHRLATVTGNGRVEVWRDDMRPLWKASPDTALYPNLQSAISWTSDGRLLVPLSGRGAIQLYETNGQPGPVLQAANDSLLGASGAPDGMRIATGSRSGVVRLWTRDGAPDGEFRAFESGDAVLAGWSPAGEWIAVLQPDLRTSTVRLFRPSGEAGPSLSHPLAGHFDWRPDGKGFATMGVDRSRHCQLVPGESSLNELPDQPGGWFIACAPIGGDYAAGATTEIGIRDGTGNQLRKRVGPVASELEWSPDGLHLACGSRSQGIGVWGADGHRADGRVASFMPVKLETALTWSPDGQTLAFGEAGRAGVATRQVDGLAGPIWAATGPAVSEGLCFAPDGRLTLDMQGTLQLWKTPRDFDKLVAEWPVDDGSRSSRSSGWSDDNSRLAVATRDGKLEIWNWDGDSKLSRMIANGSGMFRLAWSHSTRVLATVQDRNVCLWDTEGELLRTIDAPDCNFYSVAWTYDDKHLVTVGTDHSVRVWSALDGRSEANWRRSRYYVRAVAGDPAGPRFATLEPSGALHVHDLATGEVQWVGLLTESGAITMTPAGEILEGSPALCDRELFCVVENTDGKLEVLKPVEFARRVKSALVIKPAAKTP